MNILDQKKEVLIEKISEEIQFFVKQHGPSKKDYITLDNLMRDIGDLRRMKVFSEYDIIRLQEQFGEAMTSLKTLQGHVCQKPFGYSGDFKIIDDIFTHKVSSDPLLEKWDTYFNAQPAAIAVRNRKEYFKKMLKAREGNLNVLVLASGPCRDLLEFFEECSESTFQFDCLEFDLKAINYAKKLIANNPRAKANIRFTANNIFKFESDKKYDFIWSGGLFDYLDDESFTQIIYKLISYLKPNGELVIGNFHPSNPSRDYMEFGMWFLYHRDERKLLDLAEKSQIGTQTIKVTTEDQHVNCFMHMVR